MIRWIAMREALAFIGKNHRRLPRLQGGIVAMGMWDDKGKLRGVIVIGRGARLDRPDIVTISRACTDGIRNGCSKLYGKAKRLAQALGFVRLKTFTDEDEPGSSLAAVGAVEDGITDGRNMDRACRSRPNGKRGKRRRWIL